MADPLSTEELVERLERRQLGKEGQGHRAYLFQEVPIGDRRADALSIGLWNSRGHKIEAFELKTNRRDWLSEHEDHGKAEPAMSIADHFWLVTNPGVVEEHELPEQWGLLLSNGRRRHLVVAKPAPLLRNGAPPIERNMVATLIRGAQTLRWEREREIRDEERRRHEDLSDFDFEGERKRRENAEGENERMQEAFQAFRRASGFDFMGWTPQPGDFKVLGEVARALKEGPQAMDNLLRMVQHNEERALAVRKHLKEARKAIEEEAA